MISAHYTTCYFGTSLATPCHLAEEKNYKFIGCNSSGNNTYFIHKNLDSKHITSLSYKEGFILKNIELL